MELADQVESHLSLQIDVDDGRVRDYSASSASA